MDCPYPRYRIDWEKASARLYLPDYENRVRNKGILINRDEFTYLRDVRKPPFMSEYVQKVGCQQCYNCRRKRAFDWANRLSLHTKLCQDQGQECWFLTLTYDTPSLHYAFYLDPDTGEHSVRMSIRMDDVSEFMKRLRRTVEYHYDHVGVQFLGVSEYGELRKRPHFHVLLFNCPIPDRVRLPESSQSGQIQFTSPMIEKTWGKGRIAFGSVTWESCAYCAGYCYKKLTGERKKLVERSNDVFSFENRHLEWIENLDPETVTHPDDVFNFSDPLADGWKVGHDGSPVFDPDNLLMLPDIHPDQYVPYGLESVRVSRRPGLGKAFYDLNASKIYEFDQMNVKKKGKIVPVKPAKYFDRLFDLENHDRLFDLKRKRKEVAERNFENVLAANGWTEDYYYDHVEELMDSDKKRTLNLRQLE